MAVASGSFRNTCPFHGCLNQSQTLTTMPFDPHNPSPNVRALKAWIDGLDKWDLDLVMEPMDETLIHEVLPASLGKLVRNRTEYKEYFGSAMKLFASFSVGALLLRTRTSPLTLVVCNCALCR